jgi:purine/pyrimidine-nucleoside phosphorylase
MHYGCVLLKSQNVKEKLSKERVNMQFDNVSVGKKANVFFDGKCISHTVTLADGSRKSVGVILPSKLRFDLNTPEVMEVVDGQAFVSINGGPENVFEAGQRWEVQAGNYFEIRVEAPFHYVCHFG